MKPTNSVQKGGETKSVPWGSTIRAPPEILHGVLNLKARHLILPPLPEVG